MPPCGSSALLLTYELGLAHRVASLPLRRKASGSRQQHSMSRCRCMHQTCSLHAGHAVSTHLQEGHHVALQGGFWVLPRQQGVVYALLQAGRRSDGTRL